MALNGLLCRPGSQPQGGFHACEEEAVCKGSGEMELIPRPWSPDLLPLVYSDFGTQESHSIHLLETDMDRLPLPAADFRIAVHTPSSVPSWARGTRAVHAYLATPSH